MERHVGAILREARTRRGIELSEVEAVTRIRLGYLRAIEEEDWDALPGGVYTRGFIRTYASFLGLDGDRLAAEYRESVEGGPGSGPDLAPSPIGRSLPRRERTTSRRSWVAVTGVVLLGAIAIVALPDGGGEGGGPRQPDGDSPTRATGDGAPVTSQPNPARPATVRLALLATAEVWVCLLGGGGGELLDGLILDAGAEAGPFRSGSFTVSLGNGEVSMLVDGQEAEIPATPSPIGYSIDAAGQLTPLSEAERPTCA
jgi:cytoskeleton protein RodZ